MLSDRAENEVNMIPYYVVLLMVPAGVIVSMSWSVYKDRRDRSRDKERKRRARIHFGGDIELETLANARRRQTFQFPWSGATIASDERLQAGGHEDGDAITADNHAAAPRGVRMSRQSHDHNGESRGESSTHRHSRGAQGFGSPESDLAAAGLFGGGQGLSPILESDSKLGSVFLTPTNLATNSARAQSQKLRGLTYTAQVTISTPVARKIKVYTVRLPTPALFPSLDASPDDWIDKPWRGPPEYKKVAYPSLPEPTAGSDTSPMSEYFPFTQVIHKPSLE